MTTEINEKHVEMVHSVINRIANNSFLVKGWLVTLLFGILTLLRNDSTADLVFLGLPPVLLLWWLDAFYLAQERKYRKLYDRVIDPNQQVTKFSMNAGPLSMRDHFHAATSSHQLQFYGTVFVLFTLLSVVVTTLPIATS